MPNPRDIYHFSYSLLKKTRDDSKQWELKDFLENNGNQTICFLNAHAVNNAIKDPHFSRLLQTADYLLRDGIGVHLAFKALGLGKTLNLNGTDLIPKIINQYKSKKIAIFGSSDQTLNTLKLRLEKEGYTNIVSLQHGFYEQAHYISTCQQHKPDITILCMGMPRQEVLSEQLKPYTKLLICGGGWADFYSGTKNRAPKWIQKTNLEWLYRLINEPIRLGKRYTIDLLYYLYNIFQIWRHHKSN